MLYVWKDVLNNALLVQIDKFRLECLGILAELSCVRSTVLIKMYEKSTEEMFSFEGIVYLLVSMILSISGQTTLQVVWMVPFTSHPTSNFVYNASSSVAALALGLETVYNQSILPGHVFKYVLLYIVSDIYIVLGHDPFYMLIEFGSGVRVPAKV